jgi:hypothetical protein
MHFGNRHNTLDGLHRALSRHFADVRIREEGTIALFDARQPL